MAMFGPHWPQTGPRVLYKGPRADAEAGEATRKRYWKSGLSFLCDDIHPSEVLLCSLTLPVWSRRLFLGCLATSSHIRGGYGGIITLSAHLDANEDQREDTEDKRAVFQSVLGCMFWC